MAWADRRESQAQGRPGRRLSGAVGSRHPETGGGLPVHIAPHVTAESLHSGTLNYDKKAIGTDHKITTMFAIELVMRRQR